MAQCLPDAQIQPVYSRWELRFGVMEGGEFRVVEEEMWDDNFGWNLFVNNAKERNKSRHRGFECIVFRKNGD